MGNWIGNEMLQEWTGIQLFVVDALVYPDGAQQCYNFLLKSDTLNADKQRTSKFPRRSTDQGKTLTRKHKSAPHRATIFLN